MGVVIPEEEGDEYDSVGPPYNIAPQTPPLSAPKQTAPLPPAVPETPRPPHRRRTTPPSIRLLSCCSCAVRIILWIITNFNVIC